MGGRGGGMGRGRGRGGFQPYGGAFYGGYNQYGGGGPGGYGGGYGPQGMLSILVVYCL